jgi:hypothetical protein
LEALVARQRRAEIVGYNAAVKSGTKYRVRIDLSPHETVGILAAFHLDYCCMPQERVPLSEERRLHAYADGATVKAIRESGRRVEVLADARAEGLRMQKLIAGRSDRFRGGKQGPEGVGVLI